MVTEKDFLMEFNGHGNAYSSYMVIDVELKDLIKVLNDIDPDMCVGSGQVSDNGRSIYFEICKELPDLICEITEKLHCRGYSDIGAWYGAGYFTASCNGEEFDDFSAEWEENMPDRRDWDYTDYDYDNEENDADADMLWDAFVLITDNESGETFHTGEGACDHEQMEVWEDLVMNH
jgi:hypothetical protein